MQSNSHFAAETIRNERWVLEDVHGQYSDTNSHADMYRFLTRWMDVSTYLNIGYSRFGQRHLRNANFLRLIDRLAQTMLDLHRAGPFANERELLDVGSGRGGAAIHARVKYGLQARGVDITPYNVEKANDNARLRGVWPDVLFVEGDAQALPVQDASMPLIWSIESPAHFPDKRKFLAEVHRVLKPGGVFAFSDLLAVPAQIAQWPQEYQEFLRVWDVPYLETYETYRQELTRLGFDIRKSEIITKNNIAIYVRYLRRYLRYFRVRPFYNWYSQHVREKYGANLDNIREHMQGSYDGLSRGTIDYGLFWAVKL